MASLKTHVIVLCLVFAMFPITCTVVFESCTGTSVFASPRVVVFGFVIVVSVSVNVSARVVDGVFMISLGGVRNAVVAVTGVVDTVAVVASGGVVIDSLLL